MKPAQSALVRVIARVAEVQARHPLWVLLLVLLTVVPAGWAASTLKLKTAFAELLPDDKASVIELDRIQQRVPASSTLTLTAETEDTALLKRFVDEVTIKLRKLPKDLVTGVDPGPREAQQFFEKNKHLYASLKDIEALHDEVVGAYDREVLKRAGFDLGLEDDEENKKPHERISIDERFDRALAEVRNSMSGSDGYYIGENGHFGAILVRTTMPAMDSRAHDLRQRIVSIVESGHYTQRDPKFRYGFTGNLITGVEHYEAVSDDLIAIGASGVGLVLLVVFLFFLRVRALVALGISIVIGCVWSLAFARFAVGHLNTATGFLVSIIAGNGINAMVIWMARYLEARRNEKADVAAATRIASVETCEATLAVVGVTMVSYGALMTTDFRGFRHFGIIGGAGMFLCWIATYLVLPAIFVLSERLRPLPLEPTLRDRLGSLYGRPFAYLAKRFPVPIAVFGILLALGGTVATALYFTGDPMEYDLRNIQNDRSVSSAVELSGRVNKVAGRINQGGRAVVVDRVDQVEPLVAELERRRNAAPEGQKPFGKVVSVYSLLPKDQPAKLELLTEIIDRIGRARDRKLITQERYAEIARHIPRELKAIGIPDLPELVAQPFRERNGTVGTIVYVSPARGRSLNDAHYLMQWANSFRTVTLPNGDVIHGTGDAVVYADMLLNIGEDAPRVAATSLIGTALVILLAFGFRRSGWGALATLLVGVSWMVGYLFVEQVKLNFLNFVALPVAIGAGADYAINIMKRREIDGAGGIERAFVETGGAVVACSMTTLCGYLALLISINGAVRSFGLAAAIGEVSTQLAAMLVLPAVLYWSARRRGEAV